jgi:hypothetical protein
MKPLRQIEAAELMVSGKNYAYSFAAAILVVTPEEQLVKPQKKSTGVHASLLIVETTDKLIRDFAIVRRTYGTDVLTLSVICRYVESLIQNVAVSKYLQRNHSEVLNEPEHLVSEVNAERLASPHQRAAAAW